MALFSLSDVDLAAIGGASTFVLAAVAVAQIRHSSRQTAALEGQVQAVREAAEKELDTLRGQIEASVAQSKAVREAARAQLQPLVFPEAVAPGIITGPDQERVFAGELGFCYRLVNEGTGVALNVRHGIEIDGVTHEFGFLGPTQVRCIRPGTVVPTLSPERRAEEEAAAAGSRIWPQAIEGYIVTVLEEGLPPKWHTKDPAYWVCFENIFGEQFETSNPYGPIEEFVFKRIVETA